MSTTTTNLGLIKPELRDAADITAMNENWDKIDAQLCELGTAGSTGGQADLEQILNKNLELIATYPTAHRTRRFIAFNLTIKGYSSNFWIGEMVKCASGNVRVELKPINNSEVYAVVITKGSISSDTWSEPQLITPITYGTDDLTEGTSKLANGTLYFVYE